MRLDLVAFWVLHYYRKMSKAMRFVSFSKYSRVINEGLLVSQAVMFGILFDTAAFKCTVSS